MPGGLIGHGRRSRAGNLSALASFSIRSAASAQSLQLSARALHGPSRDHGSTGLTAPPGFDASGLTMIYLAGKLLP